jgi:hypothetical protein
MHLRRAADRLFGICATDRSGGIDSVTDTHVGDAFSNRFKKARRIGTRCVGQSGLSCIRSGPNIGVYWVDTGCLNANHDLSRPRLKVRHFL